MTWSEEFPPLLHVCNEDTVREQNPGSLDGPGSVLVPSRTQLAVSGASEALWSARLIPVFIGEYRGGTFSPQQLPDHRSQVASE
ncbi:hypothetical protein OJAV_G00115800 [Oryzias javanicus]|uniref:Uncharacterized protein n=1 Tax=Oryzias javanicus TaxID=123683 RepID=A0A3S2PQK7_ORYJA|nr:hypothetical protein OJAV_G00115800 [Oryzias javanicus]